MSSVIQGFSSPVFWIRFSPQYLSWRLVRVDRKATSAWPGSPVAQTSSHRAHKSPASGHFKVVCFSLTCFYCVWVKSFCPIKKQVLCTVHDFRVLFILGKPFSWTARLLLSHSQKRGRAAIKPESTCLSCEQWRESNQQLLLQSQHQCKEARAQRRTNTQKYWWSVHV